MTWVYDKSNLSYAENSMYQTVFNISEEEFSVLHYYGMWSVVHFYVVITKESVVWCTDFKPNKKCFILCACTSQ